MEKILLRYNKSVEENDIVKLKKKVKNIKEPEKKKTNYEEKDDGWTVVHHKRTEKKQVKKKSKPKEKLVNFYAFEVKAAKLQKHKELLERFEEDKRRIQKMKEQRKFRAH